MHGDFGGNAKRVIKLGAIEYRGSRLCYSFAYGKGELMSIIKNLLDSNERELRKITPIVDAVGKFEPALEKLSDLDLQGQNPGIPESAFRGEPLDKLLPEAFAVVREVSKRVLDMRHFDVQIIGGAVLHQGRIAENADWRR